MCFGDAELLTRLSAGARKFFEYFIRSYETYWKRSNDEGRTRARMKPLSLVDGCLGGDEFADRINNLGAEVLWVSANQGCLSGTPRQRPLH